MTEILSPAYYSFMNNPEDWRKKVLEISDILVEFGANLQISEIKEENNTELDTVKRELVTKKLKLSKINFNLFDKHDIASDKGFPDIDS